MDRLSKAQALQVATPWLKPVGPDLNSLIAASKNLRIELARAFPGIKFSIKTSRFSGGDSMDIRWIDGPTDAQVDAYANKYKSGSFDGMQDIYEYSSSVWTDAFGDAKYISTARENSDMALMSSFRTVFSKYEANFKALSFGEFDLVEYRKGGYRSCDLIGAGNNFWSLQELVGRTASKRTWALDKTPKLPTCTESQTFH